MSRFRFLNALTMVILLVGLFLPARPVSAAAALTVNTLADNETADGFCTLREAIIAANTNANYSGCAATGYGDDTITFSLSGTITLTSSLPNISEALIIDGSDQLVSISGNNLVKVLTIDTGINVTLNELSIINGKVGAFTPGGGVSNYGTLTVTNCTFSGNQATEGGAIHNDSNATLNVSGSTFENNSVTEYGGAIASVDGTLTVSNSTFSGNHSTAWDGGAIYGNQNTGTNTMTVVNSTFTGNTAFSQGGGIENYGGGTLTVVNSTLSGNSAPNGGGGIHNGTSSILHLKNSILANSTSGSDCHSSAGIASFINNLMESSTNCGTPVSSADPMLGPLASNGGSTQTMALLPGSPAIDAGDDAVCAAAPVNTTSQNGRSRPQGAHCDIGSVEANATLTFRSVGVNDGWILESGENTTMGGTLDSTATTFNLGDGALDKQYRAILSFNTITLPDTAVITKATLKIRKQAPVGTDPFTILGGLKVDMRKPYFGTTVGLLVSDFQAAAGRVGVATFGATPVNNWYSAVLSAAGRAYVNKTGVTQFRLYFAVGDNDDNATDYMKFFSGNYATVNARPTLIIEYYVP
jgi:CSLREA domain-containing protein